MKYLCLVYSEEKKLENFPDDEYVAYDAVLGQSKPCIALEAPQPWPNIWLGPRKTRPEGPGFRQRGRR